MDEELSKRVDLLEERVKKLEEDKSKFKKPNVAEVYAYMRQKLVGTDGFIKDQSQLFMDHYTSNGWKVGKVSMKDWKSAVRNWVSNIKNQVFNGKNYSGVTGAKPVPKGDVPQNGFGRI